MKMEAITLYLPKEYILWIDVLVGQGRYPNRSEAIRVAIRDLLRSETDWQVKASEKVEIE